MTIAEFIAQMEKTLPPAPEAALITFESAIGCRLPEDYRQFLIASNGGYIGGRFGFFEPTPDGHEADVCVNHIGGFRQESHFSLVSNRDEYQAFEFRIPRELLWVMDDPFGNAICLGITGEHRGKMYFWDHEREPDPDEWDGSADTAENVSFLANSFTDFVIGLKPFNTSESTTGNTSSETS